MLARRATERSEAIKNCDFFYFFIFFIFYFFDKYLPILHTSPQARAAPVLP